MIIILSAALAGQHTVLGSEAALNLCRPILERKAEGEISRINVRSSHANRNGQIIEGRFTAFIGMAAPGPGSASTHHLIRTDFDFRCRVSRGRVRDARINPSRS